jgi:hypothetical protein
MTPNGFPASLWRNIEADRSPARTKEALFTLGLQDGFSLFHGAVLLSDLVLKNVGKPLQEDKGKDVVFELDLRGLHLRR